MPLLDRLGRPLANLRLSVTDRCNLRCGYCMPEEEYVWLPRRDLLSFEELSRVVDAFVALGVKKVRLTGGEPLLRRELPSLVALLAAKPGIEDLALTTNGVLLDEQARALFDAGLHRLTVSLDTLVPSRFRAIARRDDLERVLRGVDAAAAAGGRDLKLDTVVMRGVNDDELVPLLDYARRVGAEVRFIEYMDVGGATHWRAEDVVSRAEMLARIEAARGTPEPLAKEDAAPADRFRLPDGSVFGIISSTTAPFCRACDRSRVTADGMWYLCLYARVGLDLRGPLRAGATDAELRELVARGWRGRSDRGAEERLELLERTAQRRGADEAQDPHFEMHTRGG